MKEFLAEKNGKLSKAVEESLSVLPFYYIKKLIKNKEIRINGVKVSEDCAVKIGDAVSVYYDEKKFAPAEEIYSDGNILVLDKRAGVSYEDLLCFCRKEHKDLRGVHRLDTNTGGLIVFAKNQSAEDELLRAFKERKIKKFYRCLVYGAFEKDAGVLKDYLKKDAEGGKVYILKNRTAGAKEVITSYKTLKKSGGTSLLEVELLTGRTHQIRAHLAYYGHFIIGDGKYGKEDINKKYSASRQCLASVKLVFGMGKGGALGYLDGKVFEKEVTF